jgi:hypothetical protein
MLRQQMFGMQLVGIKIAADEVSPNHFRMSLIFP